ncbi:hypothetical protein MNV49_001958 [Pseudohyphozyma bogoriensis]|nr:hypothetical protein MNV49_001958 [Pseudohyphozyma bogoriensis]
MSPTTFTVGGLKAVVHGDLHPPSPSPHGLAVLFLLHGRFGKQDEPRLWRFADSLLSAAEAAREKGGKDLLVVTTDHRNHGERTVDKERNKGWKEGEGEQQEFDNESHAVDMYSVQTGTARDVTFLIDFLPATIFPKGERQVTDWFMAGISLGGHSTWLAMAHDPRITLGIPIISSPSVATLLTHRATTLPSSLSSKLPSPPFPTTLSTLISSYDPINVPRSVWKGRKILVLCGKDDKLVPFVEGGLDKFVNELKEDGVDVECVVEDGVGHKLSKAMVERSCAFVVAKGLTSRTRIPSPKF